MRSNCLGRTALGLLALASITWRLEYAKGQSAPQPLDELERTQRALDQYRALATDDQPDLLTATAEPLEPGDTYSCLSGLVRLLTRLGDLPAEAVSQESEVYEGALVEAVKRFQSRHGLEPDGRIGAATFDQLNTPLGVRVRQLELAVERWRRPPYDLNRPAIVLNLPEFRLRAFSAGGTIPELEMKIVVGQAPDRKTPPLHSQLESVIFLPYWNVPASIQRDELLPEIRKDRSWVSANNFDLVTQKGEVIEDRTVSDQMLSELSTGRLQLRQKPGPKNTLGLVAFMFPNDYGLYMHDTSARWLFDQPRRDLSHGCIRVEKPEELAEWVLRNQPGWSPDRIAAAVRGSEHLSVRVERPIQLVTMYLTAVVMPDGEVHFFQDVYGEDGAH